MGFNNASPLSLGRAGFPGRRSMHDGQRRALFYQGLLHNLTASQPRKETIWKPRDAQRCVASGSVEYKDPIFGVTCNRALGGGDLAETARELSRRSGKLTHQRLLTWRRGGPIGWGRSGRAPASLAR